MAETGRMAVFHGAGRPFEIREYPVPDPEWPPAATRRPLTAFMLRHARVDGWRMC